MVDVTDIKGIGPAKADTLDEHGYSSLEDIATADQETLGDIDGVGDDRALEFIVGANDLLDEEEESQDDSEQGEEASDEFDLTPSEVSDEVEEEEDLEEEAESQDDSEEGEEDLEEEETESQDDEAEPVYTVTVDFDSRREYDTFHAALMRRHEDVFSGNQPAANALENCLEQLDDRDTVEYELNEYELNTLHTAVKQARTEYQGRNLIDHMDSLKEVEAQVDEQRRALLF